MDLGLWITLQAWRCPNGFIISSKNNRAKVVELLADYESKPEVRCIDSKGSCEALTVRFKEPAKCIDFYVAFVEATASRAVLRTIARIEEISNRARLRKNREKTAARRRKVGSEVVDSD